MKMKALSMAGWLVAVGLFAMLLAGGFQDNQTKIGVVDLNKIMTESDFGKKSTEDLKADYTAREALLTFTKTHPVMTNEQAQKLKELSVKANISAAEKTELDKLKTDIMAAAKKYEELNLKTSPTEAERAQLTDLTARAQTASRLLERWDNEFMQEMQTNRQKAVADAVSKARAAVGEVSKAQGYSVVFETQVAVYGANDLTDAAIKAMNAKK